MAFKATPMPSWQAIEKAPYRLPMAFREAPRVMQIASGPCPMIAECIPAFEWAEDHQGMHAALALCPWIALTMASSWDTTLPRGLRPPGRPPAAGRRPEGAGRLPLRTPPCAVLRSLPWKTHLRDSTPAGSSRVQGNIGGGNGRRTKGGGAAAAAFSPERQETHRRQGWRGGERSCIGGCGGPRSSRLPLERSAFRSEAEEGALCAGGSRRPAPSTPRRRGRGPAGATAGEAVN